MFSLLRALHSINLAISYYIFRELFSSHPSDASVEAEMVLVTVLVNVCSHVLELGDVLTHQHNPHLLLPMFICNNIYDIIHVDKLSRVYYNNSYACLQCSQSHLLQTSVAPSCYPSSNSYAPVVLQMPQQ